MATLHYTGRVEENGSLTIPKETIDDLGVRPGDALDVALHPLPHGGIENGVPRRPNRAMLEAMRRAEEIQRGMNPKPGRDSAEIIREGRAGAMWDYDPAE